jgi:hypothetical protein
MKNVAFILCCIVILSGCEKQNLDEYNGASKYGAENGRLVLYLQDSKSFKYGSVTVSVANKSYILNSYYPNGISCDDLAAPAFTLTEGYHSFNAQSGSGILNWSGTLYLRKGECRTFHID